ncbi:MAG: thiamine phosphate synthase [Burkholderiaceae bacterium]|nr:thiamine phosphate synthase [Burkholderiaceae bacterium]
MNKRLPTGLYALTPDSADDDWLAEAVAAAIRGGATAVQYRSKSVDAARRLRQASRLGEACRAGGALFIVNDSLELARAVGADGLHIGRDDGDPATVRAALGPQAILGVSCYDAFERALAMRGIADYCAFGSVFASAVKPAAVRAPLELFTRARGAGMHAVAIGGIDAGNAGQVAAAGAAAVAVITAVFGQAGNAAHTDASAIEANARRIVEAFGSGLQAAGAMSSTSTAR